VTLIGLFADTSSFIFTVDLIFVDLTTFSASCDSSFVRSATVLPLSK